MINRMYVIVISLFISICCVVFATPKSIIIPNVPAISQLPELPTGCEITALTMLLRYNDYNYTKIDVAELTPKSNVPVFKNGTWVGEHPSSFFIGSPYSKNAYGAYAPVIIRTLEKVAPGRSLNLSNKSFEEVLKSIDDGQPVIMWVTIDLNPPKQTKIWQTPSGKFQWIAPEHAVLVVGYDDKYIYANDPLTGKRETFDRAVFKSRWISLGKQAVSMKPKVSTLNIAFKGAPLDVPESQKPIAYNNRIWIPVRTFQRLAPAIQIIPNGFNQSVPFLRIDGKLISLETNALKGLEVKFLNNLNYVNVEFVNQYIGASHVVVDNQIRFF